MGNFVGVTWGTLQELRAYARLREKTTHLFKMGDFYFNNIDDCQAFLEDIAEATIPESWKYRNKNTTIKYPILKSYLETLFVKLKKKGKFKRARMVNTSSSIRTYLINFSCNVYHSGGTRGGGA